MQAEIPHGKPIRRLSRSNVPTDTKELARYLIGKTIVRKIRKNKMSGRIVETEVYPPGYRSGHSHRGQTLRNRNLFLGAGFAYVYFIYGTSYMLNIKAEEPGVGAGILLPTRIGITRDAERPLRFLEVDSPFVSRPRCQQG